MEKRTKYQKMMEYHKKEFLKYAQLVESDMEIKFATEFEVKVNLVKIREYSCYLQGARKGMLLWDEYKSLKNEKAYDDALLRLATSDLRYMDMFLAQNHEIRFRNHERNKKGKLMKADAYFVERITLLKEV